MYKALFFLIVTIFRIPRAARNVTATTRGAGNRNEIVIQLNTGLTIIAGDCRIVYSRRASKPSSNNLREEFYVQTEITGCARRVIFPRLPHDSGSWMLSGGKKEDGEKIREKGGLPYTVGS